MRIKIPFFNGKKLIFEIKYEQTFDEVIVSILKNYRWQNDNGLWIPDKIKAIKFLRDVDNSFGLVEAKNHVEKLMKENNIYPMNNDDWNLYNNTVWNIKN